MRDKDLEGGLEGLFSDVKVPLPRAEPTEEGTRPSALRPESPAVEAAAIEIRGPEVWPPPKVPSGEAESLKDRLLVPRFPSVVRRVLARLSPSAQDPALARQEYLLNVVLLALAGPGFLFGLAEAIIWALGRAPIVGALAGFGVLPFYLLAYWLGRRGRVRLAAYIPVTIVFLVMAVSNYQLGLGHVTLVGYAMVAVTAGILIGGGTALFFTGLSAAVYLVIGTLQTAGRVPAAVSPSATFVADTIGLALGLVSIVIFNWFYSREMSLALRREQALSAELQAHRAELERRVAERTQELSRRAIQLQAAAEVSHVASSILEPEALIRRTVNLIRDRFDYYYVGLFLRDPSGRWVALKAGTGEAGREMLAQGHRLEVGGSSMIGWCVANGQARIAQETAEEAIRFANPLLPETRSEMALPLICRGRVIGALTVQSVEPQAFSDEDIAVLQTMADQVANAIENTRLLQDMERLARRNQLISEVSGKLRAQLDVEGVLQTTVRELGLALGASEAVIRLGASAQPTQIGGDGQGESVTRS
ncbi:MAG: GAF domain-containing protein [Anaerolineae bacterium]|nr:MAG: GAF domain-containing protein [Anaerolineae bacterium]